MRWIYYSDKRIEREIVVAPIQKQSIQIAVKARCQMRRVGGNAMNDKWTEIHKLLANTRITPEMIERTVLTNDDDCIQKELSQLRSYLRTNRPGRLFKIKSAGKHSVENFEKNRLALSRADAFNDPFECMLYFDKNELLKRVRESLTETGIKEAFERSGENFLDIEMEKDGFGTADSFVSRALKLRESFLGEIAMGFSDVVKALQERTYIASLTENVDSGVMWGHYGDSHKGFAVEYEFAEDLFCPHLGEIEGATATIFGWLSLLPVMYSGERASGIELAEQYSFKSMLERIHNQPMPLCYLPQADLLLYTKLGLRKSLEWRYENEWRVIMTPQPNVQNDDKWAYIAARPKALYLGAMSEEKPDEREKLINIAREKKLPVFEMFLEHERKEYKLSSRQLC